MTSYGHGFSPKYLNQVINARIPIFNTQDKFGRVACVGLLYVKDLLEGIYRIKECARGEYIYRRY